MGVWGDFQSHMQDDKDKSGSFEGMYDMEVS
jgi:hypothetical protein